MFRTAVASAILSLTIAAVPVRAADEARPADPAAAATTEATATTPAPAPLRYRALTGPEWMAAHHRPTVLPGLYASFAALQMFDVYTTQKAIGRGASETNPMMKNVVGNRAAFWSVKAAATVGPMMAAERLWKHNKVAAIAVMAASNGIMAAVAAHNASVLNGQK
jgi:hypothetical protein